MSSITTSTTSACTSGYIFDRCPERFGKQEFYFSEAKKVVTSIASSFLKAVEEKRDLTQLFHETLAFLGQERQRIEKAQGTPKSESFGRRRDDKEFFAGNNSATLLIAPYEKYSEKLLPILQKHLRGIDRNLKEFKQNEITIDTGKLGDISSRLNISLLSPENRSQWAPEGTQEYYHKLCDLCEVTPIEGPFDPYIHFAALTKDMAAMQRLKQISIVDYKKFKLLFVIVKCNTTFECPKSDWVLATVRTEIDKKLVALSQYITWMNRYSKEDPVEHMIQEKLVIERGE